VEYFPALAIKILLLNRRFRANGEDAPHQVRGRKFPEPLAHPGRVQPPDVLERFFPYRLRVGRGIERRHEHSQALPYRIADIRVGSVPKRRNERLEASLPPADSRLAA